MKRLVLFLLLVLLLPIAEAPPTPHNIKGFIFHTGGVGTENGIPVIINDTTLGITTFTQVSAPPPFPGAYSGTINGNEGDVIDVWAYNVTHWGTSNGTLASTTEINVTLNRTRRAEPNITIVVPPEDTLTELGDVFNVSVNVSVVGGDGDCAIEIRFSNTSILNVTPPDSSIHLHNITIGTTIQTNFTVTSYEVGNSSVIANVSCNGTGPLFNSSLVDVLNNITVQDTTAPNITLIWPVNNTLNKTSNFINFTYNVTDFANVTFCELIFSGEVNETENNAVRSTTLNFTKILPNGQYNWSVNCTDKNGNIGESYIYNLTIEIFPPNITNISILDPIILNAGTTKLVSCNASIFDLDGFANIVSVNATFYSSQNLSSDPDNPNYHYTNDSCTLTSGVGNNANYTCSFPVEYYAVNNTWNCNMTVEDSETLFNMTEISALLDSLYALNITETLLDFGAVEAGYESVNLSQNITNIGNQPINVTVYGYGGVPGDGNAFSCVLDNVSVENMRFAPNITALFAEKEALSGTPKQLRLVIPKQTVISEVRTNSTFWQVHIPRNTSSTGQCNGTIIFHADLTP